MRRREFAGVVCGAVIAWPFAACGQQKIPTIGFFGTTTPLVWRPWTAAFLQRLRELGWVEGRTVSIEYRWAEGRDQRFADIAAEFVRLNVDVVVMAGTTVPAMKQATSAVPIVFAIGRDPLGEGLVESLARPGGNVTGLSTQIADLAGKRLELLRDVIPRIRTLAVLAESGEPAARLERAEVEEAARRLALDVISVDVRRPDEDMVQAFETIKSRADAIYVGSGPLLSLIRSRTFAMALAARLPTVSGLKPDVQAGGLMSYGPDYADLFRRAGDYVDKILRGAKPNDLPVEQPTRFELILNLRTAKTLGLEIPSRLLFTANEVIE